MFVVNRMPNDIIKICDHSSYHISRIPDNKEIFKITRLGIVILCNYDKSSICKNTQEYTKKRNEKYTRKENFMFCNGSMVISDILKFKK